MGDLPRSGRSFTSVEATIAPETTTTPLWHEKLEKAMDPARPNDHDPADPFNPERADHAILETIEIATEGENHHRALRKLRGPLMKIRGVHDVKVDIEHERVIVTFDARKTHPPDLHDAILKSGYKPGLVAD
jgi:copper chaperone CopZ